MLDQRILFIDAEAIILDKPAGLAVTRPKQGGLSLENYLASLTFGFQRWPEPVHRLDRDTSGCLLLARNPKALKRFAQAFEQRQVGKEYIAVLEGVPDGMEGSIDSPLFKISTKEEGWRMVVDARGKAARTDWEVLAVKEGRALVRFRPETGRTHQIRAHMASIGCPILGDSKYGNNTANRELKLKYQALCAWELTLPRFTQPDFADLSGKVFRAPKPWYYQQVLDGTLK